MIKKLSLLILIISFGPSIRAFESYYPIQQSLRQYDDYIVAINQLTQNTNHTLPLDNQELNATKELISKHLPQIVANQILYWRYVKPNAKNVARLLHFSFMQKSNLLKNIAYRKFLAKGSTKELNQLRTIIQHDSIDFDNFYKIANPLNRELAAIISQLSDQKSFIEALEQTKILTFNSNNFTDLGRSYQLSQLGPIPGNEVEMIYHDSIEKKIINWLENKELPQHNKEYDNLVIRHDPIFQKAREIIRGSNNTILVDIEIFGGVFGLSLAKELIQHANEKLQKSSSFYVALMYSQIEEHHKLNKEQQVLSYLAQKIKENPKLINNFILVENKKEQGQSGDHSKVIIADGNSSSPVALFSTKNWADFSGLSHQASALYIKGPAASLAQHSYNYDLQKNLSMSTRKNVESLNHFAITKDSIVYSGDQWLQMAQSAPMNKISNVRIGLIDYIKNAKQSILMQQFYLYDKTIISTLIKAKVANPKLDIKILLDNNLSQDLGGMPNTIYLDRLKKNAIKVRARSHFNHQQYHKNIISFDNKVLFTGSSTLAPVYLDASHREMNFFIHDENLAQSFHNNFHKTWNDPKETSLLDVQNFKAKIGGKTHTKDQSHLFNKILAYFLERSQRLFASN